MSISSITSHSASLTISHHIAGFLGSDEEDLISKQTFIRHYFAKFMGFRPGHLSHTYLDWTKRPENIVAEINAAFSKVAKNEKSEWGKYNGKEDRYFLCGIDEVALFLSIIRQAPSTQKEFVFLDIGAGDGKLGKSLVQLLWSTDDLPQGITVRIINVRGEKDKYIRCFPLDGLHNKVSIITYSLGEFRVEELINDLKKEGLDIEGRVDLITQHWCFPHLVDAVGTFIQSYNLLRPETGLFLGSGFYFLLTDQEKFNYRTQKNNVLRLLQDTRAPTLLQSDDGRVDRFIVRRLDDFPCEIEMQYQGLKNRELDEYEPLGARTVCVFKRVSQDFEKEYTITYPGMYSGCNLYGSKSLYDWLKKNQLIGPGKSWGPVLVPKTDPV